MIVNKLNILIAKLKSMNIKLTPKKTGRGAFIENSCALYAIDTRIVCATTGALSCKYSDTIYIGKLKAVEYKNLIKFTNFSNFIIFSE